MGRKLKENKGFLTDFELSIMCIIWAEGPSTVHDVLFHINGKGRVYAYTTISTTLRILVKRSFFRRLLLGDFIFTLQRFQRRLIVRGLLVLSWKFYFLGPQFY